MKKDFITITYTRYPHGKREYIAEGWNDLIDHLQDNGFLPAAADDYGDLDFDKYLSAMNQINDLASFKNFYLEYAFGSTNDLRILNVKVEYADGREEYEIW